MMLNSDGKFIPIWRLLCSILLPFLQLGLELLMWWTMRYVLLQYGLQLLYIFLYDQFTFKISQVQDCLGSLVLVPPLVSFLARYLPQEWLGWAHVYASFHNLDPVWKYFLWFVLFSGIKINVVCFRFTRIRCSPDGACCAVIERNQPGYVPPWRTISYQVSYIAILLALRWILNYSWDYIFEIEQFIRRFLFQTCCLNLLKKSRPYGSFLF